MVKMSLGIKPPKKGRRPVGPLDIKTEIALAKFEKFATKLRPMRGKKPGGGKVPK